MKIFLRHLLLFIAFIFFMCIEHAVSLPLLSFMFATFLFASFPIEWRNLLFILGSIICATVYILPFWFSLVLFFCIRAPLEFFPMNQRYEDAAVIMSVLGSTALVGVWLKYPLTLSNVSVIAMSSLIFGVVMVYFVRRRQPRQRLRDTYTG